ncbi:MAG TPA: hypothetical protein VEX13_05140 [Chloroflexia bacterium]|nr:hypothetical protein [Chloroflexia bacterium]
MSTDDVNGDGGGPTRAALVNDIAQSELVERIEPEMVVSEVELTPPSDSGTKYRIIVTTEMDEYDEPMELADMLETAPAKQRKIGDTFQGTSRRAVKLSIPHALVEEFVDLLDLIDSLPSSEQMVKHTPPVTKDKDSKRVFEEQRNVRLRVWLYAASREDDNDFHLILGRAPGITPEVFMTMELSGLPRSDSKAFPKLKAARDSYKRFFGNKMPGGSYHHYVPPIPVEIEGALFFDITHAFGSTPGPKKLRDRMPTIWEVHPISEIVFEP